MKHRSNRAWLLVIFSFLAISFGGSIALADKCAGFTTVAATSGDFKIDAKRDNEKNSWNYVLTNTKTAKVLTGPLPLINTHAHLDFFVNATGDRFVVMNSTGGSHLDNRFMIHDFKGKLIKSLGIRDILSPVEEYKMVRTVSHLFWLKGKHQGGQLKKIEMEGDPVKPATNSYGIVEKNSVILETLQGRKVVISLLDGKVTADKPKNE